MMASKLKYGGQDANHCGVNKEHFKWSVMS